jgi:hypothetical protein
MMCLIGIPLIAKLMDSEAVEMYRRAMSGTNTMNDLSDIQGKC